MENARVLSDYTLAIRDGEKPPDIGKAYSGLTELLRFLGD